MALYLEIPQKELNVAGNLQKSAGANPKRPDFPAKMALNSMGIGAVANTTLCPLAGKMCFAEVHKSHPCPFILEIPGT
jgi:hypothetical protein